MIWKLSCPVLGGAGGGDILCPLGKRHAKRAAEGDEAERGHAAKAP